MNADNISQSAGIAFSGPADKNAASFDAAFYVSSVQFSDPLPSDTKGAPVLQMGLRYGLDSEKIPIRIK